MKYAAYDDDAIYVVADTAQEAMRILRRDIDKPDADYMTAPISDEFARIIEGCWFGVRRFHLEPSTGFLVEDI